jgi:hypothetical protein
MEALSQQTNRPINRFCSQFEIPNFIGYESLGLSGHLGQLEHRLRPVAPQHRQHGVAREASIGEREFTPDEGEALGGGDRVRVDAGGAET